MTLRVYVELARLSNAPTVISSVLVGVAIALAGANIPVPWLAAGAIAFAILLLYVGGMAMNDVLDVGIDRTERPTRPIPSGRISLRSAWTFVLLCLGIGWLIVAWYGIASALFASTLVVSIVLYNLLHKRFAGAVVLMGICRGLVYLTAAAAILWPLNWTIALPPAAALMLYIVFVTIIARGEARPGGASPVVVRLSIFQIAIALAPALWIVPQDWTLSVIAALVLIGWLVASQRFLMQRPPRVQVAVLAQLAGICLLDAYYLSLLEQPTLVVIAWACFVITMIGHRRVSGT